MKIFQIYVKGICVGTDNTEFKCFSRKVYKHEPTDEEKNEFVKKCSQVIDGNSVAPTLDTNKEYNVLVGELEVVEWNWRCPSRRTQYIV